MTNRSDWEGRTGRKWAEEWRRTDRAFAGLTDRLLARVSTGAFSRALDVGCGAGEIALALARAYPISVVTGLDVSTELIAVARERGANLANAAFLVADAGDWRPDDPAPDLVVSRHGVMFFSDPVAAFANLAKGAAPRAQLTFSCFRDRSLNTWATEVTALLPPGSATEPVPDAPGPFAFADPERVERILTTAGWTEITCEPVDFAYVVGTGERAIDEGVSYLLDIGPAAAAAAELDFSQRAEFAVKLRAYLAQNHRDSLVALPAAAWIVSARVT